MKRKNGSHKWIPADVLEELEQIKKEENIFSSAEAFRKMTKNAKIGKELKRRRGFF